MTRPPRIRLNQEEYDLIQEFRGIQDTAEEMQLDVRDVKHGWLKSKTASVFFKNPEFEIPQFDPDAIDWKFIVKGLTFPAIPKIEQEKKSGIFDRLVISDAHIAMNPNPDGYSQYGGKWDEKELDDRLLAIVNTVLIKKNSNTIIVDDLGDLADGWDAQTVRKGHDLPQNMDNQKTFDVALKFKLKLASRLSQHYEFVIFNNICEDNHSGAFGYVINSAFKIAIELMADNVKVTNHRKFINHYQFKKNVFIICHGKDSKNLKFGFKPHIDKPQTEKIDNYIDANFLLQPKVRIEFSKGDSHQLLFDHSSSDRFDYFNFMALSPSSSWIQTNYKRGISGATLFNFDGTNDYDIKHIFFAWKEQ